MNVKKGSVKFDGQNYDFEYRLDSVVENRNDELTHLLKCYLFFRFQPLSVDYVNSHIFTASIDNNDVTIEREIPEGLEVVWHMILIILRKEGILFFYRNPVPTGI